jgi:hypothetical protein
MAHNEVPSSFKAALGSLRESLDAIKDFIYWSQIILTESRKAIHLGLKAKSHYIKYEQKHEAI